MTRMKGVALLSLVTSVAGFSVSGPVHGHARCVQRGGLDLTRLRAQDDVGPSGSPSGKKLNAVFDAKKFYVRPDRLKEVVAASVPFLLRAGSGALVHGWNLKIEKDEPSKYAFARFAGYMSVERSSVDDFARPEKPIQLYEFEGCPFCRYLQS
jgi:hypothetical protein